MEDQTSPTSTQGILFIMPIDINFLRSDKGGDPEYWRGVMRKRFKPVELIDKVIDLDAVSCLERRAPLDPRGRRVMRPLSPLPARPLSRSRSNGARRSSSWSKRARKSACSRRK
jgi:hypothetical protein